MIDLIVSNHGSIFLLTPVSDSGRQWVSEHIPDDAQRLGDNIAVEHRYIADIIEGAQADGLEVS
jgi:hypothetical protein